MALDRREFIALSAGGMGSALLRELLTPPPAAAKPVAVEEGPFTQTVTRQYRLTPKPAGRLVTV